MTRLTRLVTAIAVVTWALASTANATLTHLATLTPPGGSPPLFGLAASDTTVVAAAPGGGLVPGQGALDVFTKPKAGWSSGAQAATLIDPVAVHSPFLPAISGATVVAGATAPTGPGYEDVFQEPSGGWSGMTLPAARLAPSDDTSLGPPAISGSTIVAVGVDPANGRDAVYVFSQPAGGWSGTVPEVAKLTDPSGAPFFSEQVAVVGDTVFAATRYRVDVFTKPAGGWSGTVHPSAALREASAAPIPLEASSDTVLAGLSLFREPPSGWSGIVRPVGVLFPASAYPDGSIQALSGELAASSSSQLGAGHVCPCTSRLSLFTKPLRGWKGAIAAPPAITTATENGPLVSALVGRELFVTGGGSIEVYQVTGSSGEKVAPPRLSKLSLAGVAQGHPRLAFTITTKANDPPIQSLALIPPTGLAFTKSHLQLKQNVSIAGMPIYDYTVAVAHGALIVQLVSTADTLTVHVRAGALSESQALATRARQAKTLLVRATLRATDVSGDATTMLLALHGK